MSTIVFDPLYIKTIEKQIGRKLDDFEIDAAKYGEPVYFQSVTGEWKSFQVPHYKFEKLGSVSCSESSFFDYTFNVDTTKKVSSDE